MLLDCCIVLVMWPLLSKTKFINMLIHFTEDDTSLRVCVCLSVSLASCSHPRDDILQWVINSGFISLFRRCVTRYI